MTAIEAISEIQKDFPVATADAQAEREQANLDALFGQITQDSDRARDRALQEANVGGFSPSAALGLIAESENLLRQQARPEAAQRAFQELSNLIALSNTALGGLGESLDRPQRIAQGLSAQADSGEHLPRSVCREPGQLYSPDRGGTLQLNPTGGYRSRHLRCPCSGGSGRVSGEFEPGCGQCDRRSRRPGPPSHGSLLAIAGPNARQHRDGTRRLGSTSATAPCQVSRPLLFRPSTSVPPWTRSYSRRRLCPSPSYRRRETTAGSTRWRFSICACSRGLRRRPSSARRSDSNSSSSSNWTACTSTWRKTPMSATANWRTSRRQTRSAPRLHRQVRSCGAPLRSAPKLAERQGQLGNARQQFTTNQGAPGPAAVAGAQDPEALKRIVESMRDRLGPLAAAGLFQGGPGELGRGAGPEAGGPRRRGARLPQANPGAAGRRVRASRCRAINRPRSFASPGGRVDRRCPGTRVHDPKPAETRASVGREAHHPRSRVRS